MRLGDLAIKINSRVVGDPDCEVTGVATLDDAGPCDLSFLANPRYIKRVATTKAAAVCIRPDVKLGVNSAVREGQLNLLVSDDPYYAFTRAMVELVGFRKHPHEGIHPRAFVDPTASVGPGTILYPNVYIGPRAKVGKDCILYPGVVVYDDCILGDRVIIQANAVIGNDGYGFATHAGKHHKMPMPGNVVLEDDVEIGGGCVIQRATMGTTLLAAGTKLGDLVAIGHGVELGKHCLIVTQVGIAGSTIVGDYVVMAGQVGVAGHLEIGSMVKIGAKSGVMEDVPPKTDILGAPAQPIAQARRTFIATLQLPELVKRVRELERTVAKLTPPSTEK